MTFTDGLNSRDPLDDRRGRRLVVVFRSRRRPGSQNPGIEWAAKQQLEAMLLGQRKEIIETILLKKCVGINADEFGVLNKALHRLERFWTDQILYRL